MNKQAKSKSLSIAQTCLWAAIIYIGAGLIKELSYDDHIIKFRQVNADLIFSLLAPSFGLYGFRRFTDAKYLKKDSKGHNCNSKDNES